MKPEFYTRVLNSTFYKYSYTLLAYLIFKILLLHLEPLFLLQGTLKIPLKIPLYNQSLPVSFFIVLFFNTTYSQSHKYLYSTLQRNSYSIKNLQ